MARRGDILCSDVPIDISHIIGFLNIDRHICSTKNSASNWDANKQISSKTLPMQNICFKTDMYCFMNYQ